jgi:hypothetical protein
MHVPYLQQVSTVRVSSLEKQTIGDRVQSMDEKATPGLPLLRALSPVQKEDGAVDEG